jgi:hypothetical protein
LLAKVQEFTDRHEKGSANHCFACRLVWLTRRVIATQARHLKTFSKISQSTLSRHFQPTGFRVVQPDEAHMGLLLALFPALREKFALVCQSPIREQKNNSVSRRLVFSELVRKRRFSASSAVATKGLVAQSLLALVAAGDCWQLSGL